ncbi:MAG: Gldg family protein [Nannocystaceae bacterium]
MSLCVLLYLASMAFVFVAQRLLNGHDPWQALITVAGVVALGAAIGLRVRSMATATSTGQRQGHRLALLALTGACASLLFYLLSTDATVRVLGLADEAESRWIGSWGALWPITWFASSAVLMVVDHALVRSPILIAPARIREAAAHGLLAALGVAALFPINYVATQHNKQWDLRYFKTTEAGSSTLALVENLGDPIAVRVFLPPSSDLEPELRGYFDALEGPTLTVQYLDQAAEPRLSKALSVRQNGHIAFTTGDLRLGEDADPATDATAKPEGKALTRTIRLGGDSLDKARRKLKKLDEEVQKILRELGQGERIAYVTEGHQELVWSGQELPLRKISGFKQILEILGFTVRKLKASGGLADEVPDDADLVVVLGPRDAFLESEADALGRYLDRGGALFVGLEPDYEQDKRPIAGGDDPLRAHLARRMGIRMAPGVLASEKYIVARARNKSDRMNVVTDRFTSHPASTTLARIGGAFFLPTAGHFDLADDAPAETTVTIRSLPSTWADLDHDLEYNADKGEKKASYNVAAASTAKHDKANVDGEVKPWRAVVVADASFASDGALGNPQNQQFVVDSLNWLIGVEATSGRVESEEDIRIEHSREEQALWFYGMVLAVPAAIVGLGAMRVRRRRRVKRRA